MSALYAAAGFLVAAQVLGIYGLKSRKADLVFSVVMGVCVLVALGLVGYGLDDLGHL